MISLVQVTETIKDEENREAMRRRNYGLYKSLIDELGLSHEKAVKFLKLSKEEEENLLEDLQAEKGQEQLHGVAGYVGAHKQATPPTKGQQEER